MAVNVIEGTFTLEMKGRYPVILKAGQGMFEPINVAMRATSHGRGGEDRDLSGERSNRSLHAPDTVAMS